MKARTLKWGAIALAAGTAIVLRKQIMYRLRIAKTLGDVLGAHVESRMTGMPIGVILARKSDALDKPWIRRPQREFGDEFTLSSR